MKCVYGRAGVRYVITKFSGINSLLNFLTHGAPLRARFARGSSAINNTLLIIYLTLLKKFLLFKTKLF